jgi:hypothetical protein
MSAIALIVVNFFHLLPTENDYGLAKPLLGIC